MATTRDKNVRKSKWDSPTSATEAAREAARKLNVMLAAKGKLATNTTPPLRPPVPKSTAMTNNDSSSEMFTDEIEINDSPRRLVLCKGTVQNEINKYSGALILIKGHYIPPAEKADFAFQKPLYLSIQSPLKDKVDLAVKRIHEILRGDDPFSAPPIQPSSSALPSGMHYVQEKVFVGLDNVSPEFNLKENILGPGESYFQHITRETGAKIQLRGRGSGFMEPTSGREAFETLYIYISHNSYTGLSAAKKLVENLIQTVTTAYQSFQMQRSSNTHYSAYGGQGNTRPQHFTQMYMPPVSRYGVPPHHSGNPSYPPYPQASQQYPPRYNPPSQPTANRMNPSGQPSQILYPTIPEGPRHGTNEPTLRHRSPYPLPRMQQPPPQFNVSDTMSSPKMSQQPEPGPLNNDRTSHPLPVSQDPRYSEARNKQSKIEDERHDPRKRRFTEAPVKKPDAHPSPPDKQRSVSSLDHPPTSTSSTFLDTPEVVHKDIMLAPVFPAPKAKPTSTTKTDDVFKAPFLQPPSSMSASKRTLPPNPLTTSGLKRKPVEKKSTGIALLGCYDDSSDEEDHEETAKRLRNN